jgi:hypothetical protein
VAAEDDGDRADGDDDDPDTDNRDVELPARELREVAQRFIVGSMDQVVDE